jgi:molecular chaperone GrpE
VTGEPDTNPDPSDGAGEPAAAEGAADQAAQAEPEAPQDPLATAQAEAARLKDQLLRTAADFDNFRKRARREQSDAERRGREDMLRDLLPVFDNLERAVGHADSSSGVKAFADGISMVLRQLTDTLSKLGIERVQAVGAAFDPVVHEAVQYVETDQHPPGAVAFEMQAGYRMGDRLIRPSVVFVARPPAEPKSESGNGAAEPEGETGGS